MGEFSDKVFAAVQQVPRGKVATYGQIARMIGSPRSARYVGFALRNNPAPGTSPEPDSGNLHGDNAAPDTDLSHDTAFSSIPCHRIIFKDGSLTDGFAFGGPDEQRRLLEEEGVTFVDDKHVDLDACLWDGHTESTAEGSEGAEGAEGADDALPTAPPADFDWKAELG